MNSCEKLKAIEDNYCIKNIKFEGIGIWPYLRNLYHFEFSYSKITSSYNHKLPKYKILFRFIKNSIYGLRSLFRTYSFIVISTSSLRKEVHGKHYDKSFDFLIDYLGNNKTLCLEYPSLNTYDSLEGHFNKKDVYTKHITSLSGFDLLSIILEKLWFSRTKLEGSSVLDSIHKSYNVHIPYLKFTKRFFIKSILAYLLLRIYRPEKIFINCFYINQHFIFAAKKLNIDVIEIQHGAIGDTEAPYNFQHSFDPKFFPDFLLTFGDKDKELISKGKFLPKERIIPIGNWFIDSSLPSTLKAKSNSIILTLQDIVEVKTIDFILQVLALDPLLNISILSRNDKCIYNEKTLKLFKYVKILKGNNFYKEICKHKFHATVFSTTAIEAPSFNVLNILIDIENRASKRFSNFLDVRSSFYISTPEDFLKIYNSNTASNNIDNTKIIKPGFEDNLITFLKSQSL